ncbi:MAG TPA: hypothetical protein DCX70_06715 [Chitinophagaceae bacterium]|nr:hypothetical protein [Chitinophagaceae bacterium]
MIFKVFHHLYSKSCTKMQYWVKSRLFFLKILPNKFFNTALYPYLCGSKINLIFLNNFYGQYR